MERRRFTAASNTTLARLAAAAGCTAPARLAAVPHVQLYWVELAAAASGLQCGKDEPSCPQAAARCVAGRRQRSNARRMVQQAAVPTSGAAQHVEVEAVAQPEADQVPHPTPVVADLETILQERDACGVSMQPGSP
jgi:hypothetical protein